MYCRGQPNLTHTKLGWTLCFQQGTQKIAWWSLRKTPVWMSSWVNRKSHYLQSKCMQMFSGSCVWKEEVAPKKKAVPRNLGEERYLWRSPGLLLLPRLCGIHKLQENHVLHFGLALFADVFLWQRLRHLLRIAGQEAETFPSWMRSYLIICISSEWWLSIL